MSYHQFAARNVPCRPRDESRKQAQRARENRAYVRRLLSERQPWFAHALEAAVRDLSGANGWR